jgi:glycine hydroxymethyltransferase
MRKILFICTANICRSPMAEGIWNNLRQSDEFTFLPLAESAGVDGMIGSPPTSQAVSLLKAKGIDIGGHIARQLDRKTLHKATEIVCMTREHRERILGAYPEVKPRVYLLTEFRTDSPSPDPDIADPYRGTSKQYDACFKRLETEISRIAQSWKAERDARRKPAPEPQE